VGTNAADAARLIGMSISPSNLCLKENAQFGSGGRGIFHLERMVPIQKVRKQEQNLVHHNH